MTGDCSDKDSCSTTYRKSSGIIRVNPTLPNMPSEIICGPEVFHLNHLPPVFLAFSLPEEYPDILPKFQVSCPWLEEAQLDATKNRLVSLWEAEQSEIIFIFVDYLQNQMLPDLGMSETINLKQTTINMPSGACASFMNDTFPLVRITDFNLGVFLTTWDSFISQKEFDQLPHSCGICFDVKKGKHSIYLKKCHHVYCRDCLSGFFKMLIREGMMFSVVCPHEACRSFRKGLKIDSPEIRPDLDDVLELVGEESYARYLRLYRKQSFELDPLVTWCPLCEEAVSRQTPDEKLCQCNRCSFAFCRLCRKTWHGNQTYCQVSNVSRVTEQYYKARESGDLEECTRLELRYGKKNLAKLVAELDAQKQFEAWSSSNAQACPNCSAVIEKTFGCNHMTCPVCDQHFCYICGSIINKFNPYSHFNDLGSRCHMMLFEGVAENDDDFILDPFDFV
ncbi:hypothetical protein DSO57_1005080 [Entomophthora muscae]|nr:hypothetical protein DSO57_1005080 [Entomophthora muscae]